MIALFYFLAVVAGMATIYTGYLAAVPLEALRRGAAPGVVDIQCSLSALTMVVCLAAGAILGRLDHVREKAGAQAPARVPRARHIPLAPWERGA